MHFDNAYLTTSSCSPRRCSIIPIKRILRNGMLNYRPGKSALQNSCEKRENTPYFPVRIICLAIKIEPLIKSSRVKTLISLSFGSSTWRNVQKTSLSSFGILRLMPIAPGKKVNMFGVTARKKWLFLLIWSIQKLLEKILSVLWDAHLAGKTRARQEQVFANPCPEEELFKLSSYPDQLTNLATNIEYAEQLKQACHLLTEWTEQTGYSIPVNPTSNRHSPPIIENGKISPEGKYIDRNPYLEMPGAYCNDTTINHPGTIWTKKK